MGGFTPSAIIRKAVTLFGLTALPGSKKTLRVDASGQMTAEDIAAADVVGLGTLATQNANAVAITGGTITGLGTPSSNSDAATKQYVDTAVTSVMKFRGAIDCSANPNYPSAALGDAYVVSVAGRIGGGSGVLVDVGDVILAQVANAGGTQAAVGGSWAILEKNLVGALLAANNLSDVANVTTAQTNLSLLPGTNIQAYSAQLAAIAGLTPSNDDLLQRKAGAWTNRTVAQLLTDMSLSGIQTSESNATLNSLLLTILHSQTNAHVNIQPKGTGGLYLGPAADGTATGGNARGAGAVDLQLTRGSASQVASGANSRVGGQNCTASGSASVAEGNSNVASGSNSVSRIRLALDRGLSSCEAFGSGIAGAAGERQRRFGIIGATTTDAATVVALLADTNSASTTNQFALVNNSTYAFKIRLVAHQTSGSPVAANRADYEITGMAVRLANAAATSIVWSKVDTNYNGLGLTVAPVVVADTTNGAFSPRVQGLASTTLRWGGSVECMEVTS